MQYDSKSKTKKKHLEYSDRIKINFYINQNFSVNKIAKELNRSPSIICREIQRNIIVKEGNPLLKGILCSRQIERGPETLCNKCQKAAYCHLTKRYYDCHKAQEMADKRQKEKTSKMSFSHENLKQIEDFLIDADLRRLSIYQAYISNSKIKNIVSLGYLYKLVEKDVFAVSKVFIRESYKKKQKQNRNIYIDSCKPPEVLFNRTYQDFKIYMKKHKNTDVFEIDSVIGKLDDKHAILTVFSRNTHLQFGFIINKSSSTSVNARFKELFENLGLFNSSLIFKVLLCDNGYEFNELYKIEDINKHHVCRVFYTRAYAATDKSRCERNHRVLRRILRKGVSLDDITQYDLNEYFSNINSMTFINENGSYTPYDHALKSYGKAFLNAVGIRKIDSNKVKLRK